MPRLSFARALGLPLIALGCASVPIGSRAAVRTALHADHETVAPGDTVHFIAEAPMIQAALRVMALLSLAAVSASAASPESVLATAPAATLDTVVFAGGCFWGVQGVFQHVQGVMSATSGYSGGTVANPNYEQVSSGRTGHAESVRVIYDPSRVSYARLMEVFFTVAHDPTQLNRQGPDVGTQYRSAVFYTSDAQRQTTEAYVAQLERNGRKIVTQIAPLRGFKVAEAYHQDYATLHPEQPYIRYNDLPKIEQLRRQYPQLWSERLAAH
jgi:peptide-methionine (S)-S-oxide reductase